VSPLRAKHSFRVQHSFVLLLSVTLACGDGSADNEPPSLSLTVPSTIRLHDLVPVTMVADDNNGVSGVQLRVDGVDLEPEDTETPFLVLWDTREYANGIHYLTAVARDFAGNIGTAAPVDVTVSNPRSLPDRIVLASEGPTGGDFWDIYSVNGDGTGLTRLTFTDDLHEFDPAVSPDGQRIAFTRQMADGTFEIFVMNAGGGGEVNLTNNPANDLHAAWSPDGSRIAFNSNRGAGGQLFVMNSDGSGQAPITSVTGSADEPAWSPDGSLIAFTHNTEMGQIGIAVVHPDGIGFKDLTPLAADNGPAWSPDGTRIAFNRFNEVSVSHIHLMNADGSNIQGIFTAADTADSYPVWSRDGTQLIFERNTNVQTNRDIWVMNLDGGGAFKVVTFPGSDVAPDVSP
jgi:dipeptidyl aminopeptidase/acylaminoacyl peptidase